MTVHSAPRLQPDTGFAALTAPPSPRFPTFDARKLMAGQAVTRVVGRVVGRLVQRGVAWTQRQAAKQKKWVGCTSACAAP